MGCALLKAEGTTTGRFSSIFSRGAKESSQISLFGGSIYTSDASSDSLIGEQQLAGAASAISIAGTDYDQWADHNTWREHHRLWHTSSVPWYGSSRLDRYKKSSFSPMLLYYQREEPCHDILR